MKVGDRDTPGTRIYAEREFRDDAQILVATEAAGEGKGRFYREPSQLDLDAFAKARAFVDD
jgi:hypothetical protein